MLDSRLYSLVDVLIAWYFMSFQTIIHQQFTNDSINTTALDEKPTAKHFNEVGSRALHLFSI